MAVQLTQTIFRDDDGDEFTLTRDDVSGLILIQGPTSDDGAIMLNLEDADIFARAIVALKRP